MARGIRDDRPLPGAREQAAADRAAARNMIRNASLTDLAQMYTSDTRARSRDRIIAELRRRGTSNDEWQAAATASSRPASPTAAAGTGNS